MIELLESYPLEQIVIFIILLALAVKELVSLIDWFKERATKTVNSANEPSKIKQKIQTHEEELSEIKNSIDHITQMINLLVASDRDDIKAYITTQYHYFSQRKGWIDDFSLDCIEKRFAHYKEQGGNTFIDGMMEELRKLPRREKEIQGG